jgi:hypothetical protein
MFAPSKHKKTLAGLAVAALVALPLSACSDDDSGSGSGSESSAQAPQPVAVIEALQGETTAVKLDKGFTDALASLKLTPGVAGTAQLTSDGSLVFPITGGNVSVFEPGSVPNYVVGQIQHEGSGFTLTAGDTEVSIGNLNVDPGVSVVYGDVLVNDELAASSVPIFDLNGSTLNPLETKGDNAILQGTQVAISATAAGLLNDTFKTDAVKPGLLVGIATITVNTKSAA